MLLYRPNPYPERLSAAPRLFAVCALAALCCLSAFAATGVARAAAACPDEAARALRGSSGLPDCRAYELVTPPDKDGALIDEAALDDVPPQVAEDGRRVVTLSIQCFADPQSCTAIRKAEGDVYGFERGEDGWVTRPLAPSAQAYEANSWVAMSAAGRTGTALFEVPSAPESVTDDWLARGEGAEAGALGPELVLGPMGEHGGEDGFAPLAPNYFSLDEAGVVATADMSHVVYETKVPEWSFDTTKFGGDAEPGVLYEYAPPYTDDVPLEVGVRGGFDSHELIGECGVSYGNAGLSNEKRFDSLSADGRLVFFTVHGHDQEQTCPGVAPAADQLYVRVDGELAGQARSVALSLDPPESVCSSEECVGHADPEGAFAQDAEFEGASANGAVALFTSTQQLTNAASQSSGSALVQKCLNLAGPGGCNLYMSLCAGCEELSASQEAAKRELVDLSETNERTAPEGGPRVQGLVALAPDGSRVYFVAKGVLTGGEENTEHEHAESGADNLYVYEEGRRVFIARLSAIDHRHGFVEQEHSDDGQWTFLRANVTPDGRFLVFTSTRALTADDTRPEGPAQVYEYDATTRALVRVSKGQDGYNDDGNTGAGAATIVPVSNSTNAATVPARTDPTVSENGQYVFFQSAIALTPGALNDYELTSEAHGESLDEGFAQNVYEYHDGQVFMVSKPDTTDTPGGNSQGDFSPSELLGTDASGENVFFATFDALVPEDTDTQRDFYDARVCSETEPCTVPVSEPAPACASEGCPTTPPPAPLSAPASETFTGPGNPTPPPALLTPLVKPKPKPKPPTRAQKLKAALKACHTKHSKARRRACETTARKRYGPRSPATSVSSSRSSHRR